LNGAAAAAVFILLTDAHRFSGERQQQAIWKK